MPLVATSPRTSPLICPLLCRQPSHQLTFSTRLFPAPSGTPSRTLRVDNLVRPFTARACKVGHVHTARAAVLAVGLLVNVCSRRVPRASAAQAFLCEAGGVISGDEFWMDTFKTHCLVGFETVEQAVATAKHAHGKQWPPLSHKRLRVSYSAKSVPEVCRRSTLVAVGSGACSSAPWHGHAGRTHHARCPARCMARC